MSRTHDPARSPPPDQWLPYVLVGVGLVVGLLVLLYEPLPGSVLNPVVGWSALAVAFGSVYVLVARHGGPGERGPDF